jgi:hypothetical protein
VCNDLTEHRERFNQESEGLKAITQAAGTEDREMELLRNAARLGNEGLFSGWVERFGSWQGFLEAHAPALRAPRR